MSGWADLQFLQNSFCPVNIAVNLLHQLRHRGKLFFFPDSFNKRESHWLAIYVFIEIHDVAFHGPRPRAKSRVQTNAADAR